MKDVFNPDDYNLPFNIFMKCWDEALNKFFKKKIKVIIKRKK